MNTPTKPRKIPTGAGSDIFAPTETADAPVITTPTRKKRAPKIKEMVYLPEDVSKALSQCWLHRKQQDRSVTKSQIVTLALRAYLDVPPE
jgi:hypothetical protein